MQEELLSARGQTHNLILENRRKFHASGVQEVLVFDETYVAMRTVMGELELRGESLHVSELSVGTGELYVDGLITEMIYREKPEKLTVWEKLFG